MEVANPVWCILGVGHQRYPTYEFFSLWCMYKEVYYLFCELFLNL